MENQDPRQTAGAHGASGVDLPTMGTPMSTPGSDRPARYPPESVMSEHQAKDPSEHSGHAHGQCGRGTGAAASDAPGTSVTDPVCGMKVDPATPKHRFDHLCQ